MCFSKLRRSFAGMFYPPFVGLAWLVGLYFVLCFIFFPNSPILRGELSDPDDYMYLVQTIDWLKGQSWFDNTQYRLAPPDGVEVHFSRLAELPMAAFLLFFRLFGLPWVGAATLTAVFLPIVWLAGLFSVLRWASRGFVSPEWSRATAFVVLFSSSFIYKFAIGHIDHHNIIALLLLISFGGIARIIQKADEVRAAFIVGFALALAQAIALEVLPWLLIMVAFLGVRSAFGGKQAARAGFACSLAFFVFSAFFLAVTKRPADWFAPVLVSYSFVYVLMAGYIAVCFAAVVLAAETGRRAMTVAVGAVVSFTVGALFFSSYPELMKGPYGAIDPALAKLFFDNISEAIPLVKKTAVVMGVVRLLFPAVALGYSLYCLSRAKGEKTELWALSSILLTIAMGLTIFYQVRFITLAFAFSVIPLTSMLEQEWARIGQTMEGRKRFWAELGLIMLVGPLPMVFVPAMLDDRPFNRGIGLFPYQGFNSLCEMQNLEKILKSPDFYGKKPLLIANNMDSGPELLFRTEHKVLAAPYHTNAKGNLDAHRFFVTTNPQEAREIAKRQGVDLVVTCRMVSTMYLGPEVSKATYKKDGSINVPVNATFTEQLMYQKIPAWLKLRDFPQVDNYIILDVLKNKL